MEENIEKIITSIVEANFEATNKRIQTLQETLDRAITQLSDDRKDITDLQVYIKKTLAVAEGARDDIADSHKKVMTEVKEQLSPMPDIMCDAVSSSIADIKKKKWFEILKK